MRHMTIDFRQKLWDFYWIGCWAGPCEEVMGARISCATCNKDKRGHLKERANEQEEVR